MDFSSRIQTLFADGRFDANLIVVYGLMVITVILYLVVRRLLARGSNLARWTRLQRLDAVSEQAILRTHKFAFWLAASTLGFTAVVGLAYHLVGGDVRQYFGDWYSHLTGTDVLEAALAGVVLVVLGVAAGSAGWVVRRYRPKLETWITGCIGHAGNEEVWHHWFALLERYSIFALRLLALWAAGILVGLGELAAMTIGFVLRVITIVAVARLLILACGVLSRIAAKLGDRHLGESTFHRYWESVKRLFPFGERCFEAAVYVSAASLCVHEFQFIAIVADYGPGIVQCIGILFGTRVLIELLQVLLNEAFGLYDEHRHIDHKSRTLVPLLHSICQYVLYFGAVVVMLGVFNWTSILGPLLGGAGIFGLAVGFGAQNLVTDVVSGFFILFENQYLVGDYVQIGDASGTVEAVGIRLTQIRDAHGKLYIIPNGQVKTVINFSKGYVNAVVDVRVPSGSDLEAVFRAMSEAGRRLRQAHKGVLADTVIHGVVEMGTSEMTVRAVTKVHPGTHGAMQNEYRRLLKQVFDENKDAIRKAA